MEKPMENDVEIGVVRLLSKFTSGFRETVFVIELYQNLPIRELNPTPV